MVAENKNIDHKNGDRPPISSHHLVFDDLKTFQKSSKELDILPSLDLPFAVSPFSSRSCAGEYTPLDELMNANTGFLHCDMSSFQLLNSISPPKSRRRMDDVFGFFTNSPPVNE
eukprot:Awhi_evm1s9088